MYQPLTREQFEKARQAGFSTEQIIAMEQRRKQEQGGFPTQEPEQVKRAFSQKAAGVLGVEKAGQGIATSVRAGTGELGQTLDQEIELLNQQAEIKRKYKPGSPERKRALEQFDRTTKGGVMQQSEIDPGTTLSNKEVLGSFGNVATTILGAGSLPTKGFVKPLGTSGFKAGLTNTGFQAGKPLAKGVMGKIAEGAAFGYASDVSNNAMNNKDNILQAGIGTGVGVSLPIVTKTLGALIKGTTGTTTGVGKNVITRAVERPTQINNAIKTYTDDASKAGLVERAKSAIYDYLGQRNLTYGDEVATLKLKEPFKKQEIVNAFSDELSKFKGKIGKEGLEFNSSSLSAADKSDLQTVWQGIKEWQDFTPRGVDDLRQFIKNNMDDFKATKNSRASVVLGGLQKYVTSGMEKRAPGYAKMLGDYGKKTQRASDLLSEFNLKGNAKPSTQLSSIMKLFKKDPAVLQNLEAVMGKEGVNSLQDDVAGALLSGWLPKGTLGLIEQGSLTLGGLYSLISGGAILPELATAAAVSSPKIVGKGAVVVGKGLQKGLGTALRRATTVGASKL